MIHKLKNWLFINSSTNQTIAKNAFWLFFGQIMGRLLRASIVIYAARALGAAEWGAFSYALGVAAFLTTFSDIGINALIIKEAARNPELKDHYLSTAFFIKLTLAIVLAATVLAFIPQLSAIKAAEGIMPILILVFAFDTMRDLGTAVSRALEKMQIEAGIQIFTNFAIVAAGFIALYLGGGIKGLALAYAIGTGLGLLAILYTLREHFKNILTHFDAKLVKIILATAWPFGLMGLMGVINLNTDIIMIGWLRSPEEVGYYSVAQKIVQLLYVLPAIFASSIFPPLSRLVKNDPVAAKKLLKRSLKISFFAAIFLAVIGFFGSTAGIRILFGSEYLPAVASLRILIASLLIVYPSMIIGNAVYAYDHHKSFAIFVVVSFLGNVIFNALWIPIWGIEGAAVSTLITQFITNALIWRKMNKILAAS